MRSSFEEAVAVLKKWREEATPILFSYSGDNVTFWTRGAVLEVRADEASLGVDRIFHLVLNLTDAEFDYEEPRDVPEPLRGAYISHLTVSFTASESLYMLFELPISNSD